MEPTALPRDERRRDGGAARCPPRTTADAVDHALVRLATTIDALVELDDLDAGTRVPAVTRRSALRTLVGHVDRAVERLHPRGGDGDGLLAADGEVAASALGVRRQRLAEAFEHALERALPDDPTDLVDELDALLARVELAHVSLDVGYELSDLPPASIAACARVSAAFALLRSTPAETSPGPTARGRGGIPWPRDRRSS